MRVVDLRSDTVTLPTPEMRRAMYEAELGDDVFGEDPTVNRLQEVAAQRMGKEAALFVASGTMGNLVAILTHCGRGDEVIMGDQAHTFMYEVGGAAALGGIQPRLVPNRPDGTLPLESLEAAIRAPDVHYPISRLVCLENTHNRCGGAVLPVDYMQAVGELVHRHGLSLHLDGARIFNAAIALGVEAQDLAAPADSVMFCLSKGLSCPVGSILCGSQEFIERARRNRKMVGGGMRQVGVLAAAGLVALETMVERLADDHAHARRLAEGLSALPGITLDPDTVRTNIVIFEVHSRKVTATAFVEQLAREGVKMLSIGGAKVRAVTHYGIEGEDIEYTLMAARKVLEIRP
ncbi:MAG: low-specificity L-threonine aldolase [Chloroflexi bacterium]|nr:low-specificity L-threonine aldolase [Chloroflexota bacterium]